jgi:hypothetical protein
MSTRCFVGYQSVFGGSILGSYCHHDGYLSGVGYALYTAYSEPSRAKWVVTLGDKSCINRDYAYTAKSVYDDGMEASEFETVEEFIDCAADSDCEFAYIYVAHAEKWVCVFRDEDGYRVFPVAEFVDLYEKYKDEKPIYEIEKMAEAMMDGYGSIRHGNNL